MDTLRFVLVSPGVDAEGLCGLIEAEEVGRGGLGATEGEEEVGEPPRGETADTAIDFSRGLL